MPAGSPLFVGLLESATFFGAQEGTRRFPISPREWFPQDVRCKGPHKVVSPFKKCGWSFTEFKKGCILQRRRRDDVENSSRWCVRK